MHNTIANENPIYLWKPAESRFTNTSVKGGVSGWPQAGLYLYIEKLKQELKYQKELNKKHKDTTEQPYYFMNVEDENTFVSATWLQDKTTDAEDEVFQIVLSDDNDDDSNSATSSQHGDCDNDDNDDGLCELILDTKEKNNNALPNIKNEATVSV